MPRIENCGPNVDEFCRESGDGSSTHDVCAFCAPGDGEFITDKNLTPYNGDPVGTDGWGGEVEHPCFEGEDYRCTICNAKLTEEDN